MKRGCNPCRKIYKLVIAAKKFLNPLYQWRVTQQQKIKGPKPSILKNIKTINIINPLKSPIIPFLPHNPHNGKWDIQQTYIYPSQILPSPQLCSDRPSHHPINPQHAIHCGLQLIHLRTPQQHMVTAFLSPFAQKAAIHRDHPSSPQFINS